MWTFEITRLFRKNGHISPYKSIFFKALVRTDANAHNASNLTIADDRWYPYRMFMKVIDSQCCLISEKYTKNIWISQTIVSQLYTFDFPDCYMQIFRHKNHPVSRKRLIYIRIRGIAMHVLFIPHHRTFDQKITTSAAIGAIVLYCLRWHNNMWNI